MKTLISFVAHYSGYGLFHRSAHFRYWFCLSACAADIVNIIIYPHWLIPLWLVLLVISFCHSVAAKIEMNEAASPDRERSPVRSTSKLSSTPEP